MALCLSRFNKKFIVTPGCWIWTATNASGRYGLISSGGKWHLAHRVSYILNVGDIPAGMCVLHRCDNPKCVNPSHLFLGTHADNMLDMAQKGRARHTKLSVEQAKQIFRDTRSQRIIAADFGVSQRTVSVIKSGKMRQWMKLTET